LRWLIGALLVVGGMLVVSRPFRMTTNGDPGPIRADCRSPLIGAWNTEEKGKVALWAVTDATKGERYYEVREGEGAYCAEQTRQRLALGSAAVVVGVAIAVLRPRGKQPTVGPT
jgi:hypothetical protein